MEGSSRGSSGRPPTLLGAPSGVVEACPSPCNRGCAPYECFVKLLKSCHIEQSSWNTNRVMVRTWVDERRDFAEYEMPLDNVAFTIPHNVEVENVEIANLRHASVKTLKRLSECVKAIPSLKSLTLSNIDGESLYFEDAKDFFSIIAANNVLQNFNICFNYHYSPSKTTIVAVLVDVLLQNQALHETTLDLGSIQYALDVMRELRRYSKAPNNVLKRLACHDLSDNQVQQLLDMLCDFKQLKTLTIKRIINLWNYWI